MKYQVEIEEVLRRLVEIEADSADDAENKVLESYRNSEIVLDAGDFIGMPTIKALQ